MTLLVWCAAENCVYVDSYQLDGGIPRVVEKWLHLPSGEGFTLAGSTHEGRFIASQLLDAVRAKQNVLTFATEHDTVVLMPVDGAWYMAMRLDDQRMVVRPLLTEEAAVTPFGGGWQTFHLFYAEHDDVMSAFKLACRFDSVVEAPIRRISVEGTVEIMWQDGVND